MLLAAACTVNESQPRCASNEDCAADQRCYRRFCVIAQPEGGPPPALNERAAAESGSVDAGSSQTPAADSSRVGDPGVAASAGPGAHADEPCKPSDAAESGAAQGSCCDGPVACYEGPPQTRGVGVCRGGERACVGGRLGPCEASRTPRSETCDNEGQDDDCDGVVDDVEGRDTVCVLAPDVAANTCDRQGAWRCVKGMRSLTCVALNPRGGESCNRRDDDCDGKVDESFDLARDRANCGACGVSCGAEQLCCAGACVARDNTTGNGCPTCDQNNPCVGSRTCCNGRCWDLASDPAHCGECGVSCGDGQRCCAGACTATTCR